MSGGAWAALIVAAIWTYLLAGRGGFWRVRLRREETVSAPGTVVAVVPARDEADVIAQSLRSLLAQPAISHIIVVDDHSCDATAAIARDAAAQAGRGDALTVVAGEPLPEGWTGKLWAVQQGVERARSFSPRFLLLTDADIEHGSNAIATLSAIADNGGYDLASYMVRLRCETTAEKILIPPFAYFFFKLYPPAWVADSGRSTAGAAGGCMLIKAEVLERIGGVAAIRDQVIDDCALAAAVKRSGGRLWLGLAPASTSLRSYESAAAIGRMISRSAYHQLRHSVLLLAVALLGMLLTYMGPLALMFSRARLVAGIGVGAFAAMTLSYLPMVRYCRRNPLWSATLPVAAVFYMGATLHSAVAYWRGRGGQWKGRIQDPVRLSTR